MRGYCPDIQKSHPLDDGMMKNVRSFGRSPDQTLSGMYS